MKEYIEKADAINLLWLFADESCASVVSDFEGLPAADVAEVRHAFWSDYGSGVCCTNCGVSLFHQDENNNWGIEPSKFMFCPSCGALMDEEADLDEAIEKYLKIKEGGQHGQAENLRGAWG